MKGSAANLAYFFVFLLLVGQIPLSVALVGPEMYTIAFKQANKYTITVLVKLMFDSYA